MPPRVARHTRAAGPTRGRLGCDRHFIMPALTSRAAANALSGLLTRRSLLGCGLLFSASSVARAADSSGLSLPPLEDGYKRLYLCRHGETDFNLENRIQGRPDNPLNSNGQAQARALSRYLASEPLDVITSSTLQRARSTTDAVAQAHPDARRVPPLSTVVEMCFGDLEGERLDVIEATYKSYVASWRAGDSDRAWPGAYGGVKGESPRVVAARGIEGLRTLGVLPPTAGTSSLAAASDRTFLLVAHGRFNKILISALQGDVSKASDLAQGNTCINVLDFDPDGRVVVRALNVRDHILEPAAVGAATGSANSV